MSGINERFGNKCSPSFRRRVIAAFGGVCELCGRKTGHYPHWPTVDRIVPRAKGGLYMPDNVTLACLTCNGIKSDGEFVGPVRSLEVMEATQ